MTDRDRLTDALGDVMRIAVLALVAISLFKAVSTAVLKALTGITP